MYLIIKYKKGDDGRPRTLVRVGGELVWVGGVTESTKEGRGKSSCRVPNYGQGVTVGWVVKGNQLRDSVSGLMAGSLASYATMRTKDGMCSVVRKRIP